MTCVSTTLTTELLQHRAGTKSYWRGHTYRDSVQSLRVHSRHVAARVRGSDDAAYVVQLSWSGTHLVGACSCPHGSEGFFCKHCVAVGLVLLDRGETVPPPDAEDVELKDVLRALPPDVLRDLLYEQAAGDVALRARIISAL